MKYGILCCGYACDKDLDKVMSPWFNLSKKYNFVFSFVNARFKEYEELNINQNNTKTLQKLLGYIQDKKVNYLESPSVALYEHEARNLALNHLLHEKVDFVWLLDLSDEFYTEGQIEKIIEYINRRDNYLYCWFSIPFKNYIFSGKEYIKGFCPPRIFRRTVGDMVCLEIDRFYFDNDILYKVVNDFYSERSYKILSNKSIPDFQLNGGVCHVTWLDNETSHQKVLYHEKHFKHGAGCSYKWENGHLSFNENYYNRLGIPIPEVYKD